MVRNVTARLRSQVAGLDYSECSAVNDGAERVGAAAGQFQLAGAGFGQRPPGAVAGGVSIGYDTEIRERLAGGNTDRAVPVPGCGAESNAAIGIQAESSSCVEH